MVRSPLRSTEDGRKPATEKGFRGDKMLKTPSKHSRCDLKAMLIKAQGETFFYLRLKSVNFLEVLYLNFVPKEGI